MFFLAFIDYINRLYLLLFSGKNNESVSEAVFIIGRLGEGGTMGLLGLWSKRPQTKTATSENGDTRTATNHNSDKSKRRQAKRNVTKTATYVHAE